jgi:hypothetical protein
MIYDPILGCENITTAPNAMNNIGITIEINILSLTVKLFKIMVTN